MILLVFLFAVLAAAFAAQAALLTAQLHAARSALAARGGPSSPPPEPRRGAQRLFECRREHSGVLWFPVLTAGDEDKAVVGIASGLPHCGRCVRPLRLVAGRGEEWVCSGCAGRHPGSVADMAATDAVLTGCLREFFARHPDFGPAPALSAPKLDGAALASR